MGKQQNCLRSNWIILDILCQFWILSQQDPVDNNTLSWRVILNKYSMMVMTMMIIIITIIIIVINIHASDTGKSKL